MASEAIGNDNHQVALATPGARRQRVSFTKHAGVGACSASPETKKVKLIAEEEDGPNVRNSTDIFLKRSRRMYNKTVKINPPI